MRNASAEERPVRGEAPDQDQRRRVGQLRAMGGGEAAERRELEVRDTGGGGGMTKEGGERPYEERERGE